ITAAGNLDALWNPSTDGAVLSLAMDVSGNVYAAGQFTNVGGVARNRVAKLSTINGSVDGTWNADASNDVNAVVVDAGGSVFAGRAFHPIGGPWRKYHGECVGTTC